MNTQNKILVAMTNHADYPTRHDKTGLWFTELTHFFEVADKAGFAMDFISPKGGAVPLDERSLNFLYVDKQAHAYLADTAFQQRLQHTKKPSDVQPSDYRAIYFTGGHGVMFLQAGMA